MMVDVPRIAADMIKGCDTSEKAIQKGVSEAPGILRSIVDSQLVTKFLPGYVKQRLIDAVMVAVHKVADLLYELIDLFRYLARSAGNPQTLRTAAASMITDVSTASKTLVEDLVPGSLQGTQTDNWDSPAAVSYASGLAEQSLSTSGIGEIARNLDLALRDMADSIESFYTDAEIAYLGLAISVGGLAVAIATAGPTLGVGTVLGLVASVAGLIMSIWGFVSAFTNSANRNSDDAAELAASPSITWTESAFAS